MDKFVALVFRIGRLASWLILVMAVLLAITITSLRLFLPNLDHYKHDIEAQLLQNTGVNFQVENIQGYWGNIFPSLALTNLQVILPNESTPIVTLARADAEVDLLPSLFGLKLKLANIRIQGLEADVSRWPLLNNNPKPSSSSTNDNAQSIKNIQNLFLRQLGEFSLSDSKLHYRSLNDEVRVLEIDTLRWQNDGNQHKAEGLVSIAGANLNKLSVIGQFSEDGDLRYLDGDFFVSGENIRVTPWMTQYLNDTTTIQSGRVSLNAWLTLDHGQPNNALVEILPSYLNWGSEDHPHKLNIKHAVVELEPKDQGWMIRGQQFDIETNQQLWPQFDFSLDWQPDQKNINLSQLEIGNLAPLTGILSDKTLDLSWVEKLSPKGLLTDIRVHLPKELSELTYSAQLTDGGLAQWYLLPEVHKLSAEISGNANHAAINAQLKNDELPYGDVFQAPLRINDGKLNFVWQRDDQGWSIWADHIQVTTPDLQAKGVFRLDFPNDESPVLSIYAEADVLNAAETWRYLPTLALGQGLTDYLSSAIQGGTAKTAKILWYGSLADFPYNNHKGIFQVDVGLKNARFRFDRAWPDIAKLDLDLLFENDAMYLDASTATLMGVKANRVTGKIPTLAPDGHLEINASARANGQDIHEYMMATPLVDSVGAALTAVQVSGPVDAKFSLKVPFDGTNPKVTGYARLKDNPIEVQSPAISLEKANGKITFNDDVVIGEALTAELFKQPIKLDFSGQAQSKNYGVSIKAQGDAKLAELRKEFNSPWLEPLSGSMPWQLGVDLQLNDVGFTYQLEANSDLEYATSSYPAPLSKGLGDKMDMKLHASGNQDLVSAEVSLSDIKYQADINIVPDTPVLNATNLMIGPGEFKASPFTGHFFTLNNKKFDADAWIDFLQDGEHNVAVASAEQPPTSSETEVSDKAETTQEEKAEFNFPVLPMPETVSLRTNRLVLGGLDWHKVKFNALHRPSNWQLTVSSSEIVGSGNLKNQKDLTLNLDSAHLFFPQWEEEKVEEVVNSAKKDEPLISEFDRQFHQYMPNLKLKINDLWLQGYKVGQVNMDLEKQQDKFVWKNLELKTGTNHLKADGWWLLSGEKSQSDFNMSLTGKNNSEVMQRFGINSGLQKAAFNMNLNANWHGAPWSVQTETLNGNLKTKFTDGVITDVNGAARLLGMFSLDSIIRKMKLDFTGVFDDGMTFDSIEGTGKVTNGIFMTNDLEMDGSAGDLEIKGKANLTDRLVDAEVTFTPDLTSSIPVVAAFAVTPQAALAVFALTQVLSPVVEVFTKVQYSVKGPFEAPEVEEISRSKGEYKLND